MKLMMFYGYKRQDFCNFNVIYSDLLENSAIIFLQMSIISNNLSTNL